MNINKYLPYLSALGFSTIFGFSFLFTKEGLDILSPFHLLAFRFGLAALVLSLLMILKKIKINFSTEKKRQLFILAIFQPVLYFIFETIGIKMTSSSEAGLMIALIPIVVTVLATIFLNEKQNKYQLFSIILSVSGVIFIILMKNTTSIENINGLLILAGAVLTAAIYNILSRNLSLNFTPVEITFVMMWVGAIIFNLITFIKLRGNIHLFFLPLKELKVLIPILYLGLLSSILAFFLMNYTLSRIKAAQSAVFANLTTVISIIAGVLIRNEEFYWYQFVGAIMIITGVWGTNYFGKLSRTIEELKSEQIGLGQ
jgi:drug/metabolite transporter (DMT)-like permease